MYLIAVKSFALQIRPRAIYVLDDGSLGARDRATLAAHLPGHELQPIEAFRSPHCPHGGTWERLLAISDLVSRDYVVQLDADTLTLGPMPEVETCVRERRAFTIGTWDGQEPETMDERRTVALEHASRPGAHIQVIAEASLNVLRGFEHMQYIRGCSAFTGFPRGSFARTYVEELSSQMRDALGVRWSEWGTEQFMSNVIIANTTDPVVLPHPRYCDCTKWSGSGSVFVHFIGKCRFAGNRYARAARDMIVAWGRKSALREAETSRTS